MDENEKKTLIRSLVPDVEFTALISACGIQEQKVLWAFLGGSLVQGWGNADSDLDIYLVVEALDEGFVLDEIHQTRLRDGAVPVASRELNGRKTDLEVWTTSQVDEIFKALKESKSTSSLEGFSYFELDLLEKLGHGHALINPEAVARQKERLAASPWRSLHIEQSLLLVDIYLEDALGQLEANDARSAVLSTKLAFGHAVDAVATSQGGGGHNPKWRARRLEGIARGPLRFEEYWSIETMRTYEPDDAESWVRRVAAVCRRISSTVGVEE